MLSSMPIYASLPAADIDRARAWYAKIGFAPVDETPDGGMYFESGDTRFFLYPSGFAGTNQATAAAWAVDDIEAVAADLRGRGVVFEEYDFDDFKTEDGIATLPDGSRGGWFKDSEGNILGVFQQA